MSDQVMHVISGLPRSGSTLLSALLRQNPRFYASIASPLHRILAGNIELMGADDEISAQVTDGIRAAVLRSVLDGFLAEMADRPVHFDTNRGWCAALPLLHSLAPEAKVIACVRNVAWVMDSIERLYRGNPYSTTKFWSNAQERATVYSRTDALVRPNRLVGYAWTALKEAFYGEHASKILILDYEILAKAPGKALGLVYDFIGEPYFDGHDFDNAAFEADRFDQALRAPGLHRIRPKVGFEARPTVLPPDLFQKYAEMDFWRTPAGSQAHMIVPRGRG